MRGAAVCGVALACVAVRGVAALATPADGAMPRDTVKLSDLMATLSTRPGFTDEFLGKLAGGGTQAAMPLTPDLRHDLRELILGKNWHGLDGFPGWTMNRLNPVVGGIEHVAKQSGPDAGTAPSPAQTVARYLDLGPYRLDVAGTVDLDQPATGPGFDAQKLVVPLVDGVTTGDGPDPLLAPMHAESQRLADVLNRLGANTLAGAQLFTASFHGQTASSPGQLIAILQAAGEPLEVDDSRYFANFGSLNWQSPAGPREVMMPFWLDSQLRVPGTDHSLLVPVSHAEYEWRLGSANLHGGTASPAPAAAGGPRRLNAAVSFWFGIDGKTEFRTMDQVEQRWVMGRHAHVYTGHAAAEVTELAGRIEATYMRLHLAYPAMPFGGYYRFGVCQDVVAAIELKMTGRTTLFPNTADDQYFPEHAANPADDEVNALIRRLPKDGHGTPPTAARVFGSLPLPSTDEQLAKVTIPGLAPDLIAVNDAWRSGSLEHPERRWWRRLSALAGLLIGLALLWRLRPRKTPAAA